MLINVIGGSGFIGTRLVERLLQKDLFRVKIIDQLRSTTYPSLFVYGDVRSEKTIRETISPEAVIINLAAEHRDDVFPRKLYYEVNVDGAKNICSIASEKNVNTIIFTSTVAIYGFTPRNTNESGIANPFNDYGRSKYEAENIYLQWYEEDPENRSLVILRPTVVFGERNRGNVFNLLKQIASGKFVMIGDGLNRKSMAYVENVAAFLEYSLSFGPGIHIYNYIDKPDLTMNQLVDHVYNLFGSSKKNKFRLPFSLGLLIGRLFDFVAKLTCQNFPISAIRVKKFCANSVYESAVESTGFKPPVTLIEAIDRTVRYEFIELHKNEQVFYSE